MKKILKQVVSWLKPKIKAITPGTNAVKGASYGLIVITALLWFLFGLFGVVNIKDIWLLLLFLGFTIIAIAFGFGVTWVLQLVNSLPRIYKLAFF